MELVETTEASTIESLETYDFFHDSGQILSLNGSFTAADERLKTPSTWVRDALVVDSGCDAENYEQVGGDLLGLGNFESYLWNADTLLNEFDCLEQSIPELVSPASISQTASPGFATDFSSPDLASSTTTPSITTDSAPSPTSNKRTLKRRTRKPKLEDVETKEGTKSRHRRIEKKYRSRLTSNLDQLRACVPSLLDRDESPPPKDELLGLKPTRKQSKAMTFLKATEYIEELRLRHALVEKRAEDAESELAQLRAAVESHSSA